ncbi:MAG: phosphoribosylanthranilate isomerase [Spirochaetes bacterium]|nr:phosphoribosylanthranilate isomerase [Spirochaetota bacterium]
MENPETGNAMILTKICGLTLVEDAVFAAEHGADFLGIVMSETSPRRANLEQVRAIIALDLPQPKYLVFGYDDTTYISETFRTLATSDTRLQIMADHPDIERLLTLALPERTMPSISAAQKINHSDLKRWEKHPLVLFDSHRTYTSHLDLEKHTRVGNPVGQLVAGGTGKTFDPANIANIKRPYLFAGGLTADNVADIVAKVHPPGVDVASGIEQAPGIKDRDKLKRFIANAKQASQATHAQQ